MENFWKIFSTLFGIGVAVSFAKSLKSKKKWQEVLSECIITGALASGAGLILAFWPQTPLIAVAGGAAILAVLGYNFLGEKIEKAIDMGTEKYLGKKNGE